MSFLPKVTPRQLVFLDKLRELYREYNGPVHYSDVAERLGVNRFSAYDMLKVLEKKGLASSSYALAAGHSGPGRSMVVFSPTAQATLLLGTGGQDDRLGDDWRRVREHVLQLLSTAREVRTREALDELLARLHESRRPLEYCTEMIGVLLLNMRRAKTRAGGLNPFRALASLRLVATLHWIPWPVSAWGSRFWLTTKRSHFRSSPARSCPSLPRRPCPN